MTDPSRDVAASLGETLAASTVPLRMQKAKVTAVNTGPPKSVDLLIEDKWAVAKVRYLLSYATPATNDAVYLITYGTGRRVVIGKEA